MLRILLLGGLLAGFLAYCLYEPLPSYVQDRALVTFSHAVYDTLGCIGKVTEFFNVGAFESLLHLAFGMMVPAMKNTSSVQLTVEQFGRSRTLVAMPTDPSARSGAAVILIHGGGWVFGSPDFAHELITELAEKTGATYYAIGYRLAPEHKFPAAFDDCMAATEAIFKSAPASGVDPSRIAIAGDSAGGQLTASVVQQLSRLSSPYRPKMQVMLYPVTQAVNMHTESYLSQKNAPIIRSLRAVNFISLYLTGSKVAASWISNHGHITDKVRDVYERATGETLPKVSAAAADVSDSVASQVASLVTDFRVSPLLGEGLERLQLPPAHILACEFDTLLDDSLMYAKRLERSGVRTHLHRFRTYHAAVAFPKDGLEIREYLVRTFRDLL